MPSEKRTRLTIDYIPSAPVFSVSVKDTLEKARTLMELYEYSQLPVVSGQGERKKPIGVVSWETIGRALIRDPESKLEDCIKTEIALVKHSSDLLSAIPSINRDGAVLVINEKGFLIGIVTSSDLGDALVGIARPYLAIAECERILRALITHCVEKGYLKEEELHSSTTRGTRSAEGVDGLTLGEAVEWFTTTAVWESLGQSYDLGTMRTYLQQVVMIRNNVMHFRPTDKGAADVIGRAVKVLTEIENQVTAGGLVGAATPSPK